MTWRRQASFTDDLSLDFVKEYLKVGYNDEDALINLQINASLTMVERIVQKAVFNTDYVDFLPIGDTVPSRTFIRETNAPTSQPTILYTDTGGATVQYPSADIQYDYIPPERTITLCMTGDLPAVEENSLLEVRWSVIPVGAELIKNARLRLIAGWYEKREAESGNFSWVNGVESLLSPISIVL